MLLIFLTKTCLPGAMAFLQKDTTFVTSSLLVFPKRGLLLKKKICRRRKHNILFAS